MTLKLHRPAAVRGVGDAESVGQSADLEQGSGTAGPAQVGLDDIDGFAFEEAGEVGGAIEVFAGGDGDIEGAGEGGVAVDVVGGDGFLPPGATQRLESAAPADGFGGGECDLYRACAGERLQSVADGVGIGGAAVYLDVEFGNEH